MMLDPARLRERMVVEQLERRGIREERVLAAMRSVPREAFVPAPYQSAAYADGPLPIGEEQTISQPYVVARMAELAEIAPADRVLDVGCGCGYQTAVLAELAAQVYGMEVRADLARRAGETLTRLETENAVVIAGDGGYGLPEHAPFDAILVAAAAAEPPRPLLEQLADGGRLILPLGGRYAQQLTKIVRRAGHFERSDHGGVRFVAFIGDFGHDFGEDREP